MTMNTYFSSLFQEHDVESISIVRDDALLSARHRQRDTQGLERDRNCPYITKVNQRPSFDCSGSEQSSKAPSFPSRKNSCENLKILGSMMEEDDEIANTRKSRMSAGLDESTCRQSSELKQNVFIMKAA